MANWIATGTSSSQAQAYVHVSDAACNYEPPKLPIAIPESILEFWRKKAQALGVRLEASAVETLNVRAFLESLPQLDRETTRRFGGSADNLLGRFVALVTMVQTRLAFLEMNQAMAATTIKAAAVWKYGPGESYTWSNERQRWESGQDFISMRSSMVDAILPKDHLDRVKGRVVTTEEKIRQMELALQKERAENAKLLEEARLSRVSERAACAKLIEGSLANFAKLSPEAESTARECMIMLRLKND